jgi:hypothetical protein
MGRNVIFILLLGFSGGAFGLPTDVDPGTNGYGYMRVIPSELVEEDLFYVYNPDRNIRRAEYSSFYFPKESLKYFISESMFSSDREVPFFVFFVKMKGEVYDPDDDSLPSPEGGFHFHRFLVIPVDIAEDPGTGPAQEVQGL